jgi:hypothetical protein
MSTKPIPESSPDFASPLAHAINELIATRPETVPVPASAQALGTPGQIAFDFEHFYVCVAVNVWRRTAWEIF